MEFTKYDISTPYFNLNNKCLHGRIVNIIDGDSLVVVLPLFDSFYKFKVRINGIDTCEMNSKHNMNKELAYKARDELIYLVTKKRVSKDISKDEIKHILNKDVIIIYLECKEFDKYGRLLADVYLDDSKSLSLGFYLLENHLAYKYTGETKLTEDEQLYTLK